MSKENYYRWLVDLSEKITYENLEEVVYRMNEDELSNLEKLIDNRRHHFERMKRWGSSNVTIKFFDVINECYIDDNYSDPNYSSDLAVNDDGNVFNIKTHFLRPYIEPHFYKDGERIA